MGTYSVGKGYGALEAYGGWDKFFGNVANSPVFAEKSGFYCQGVEGAATYRLQGLKKATPPKVGGVGVGF